MLGGAPSASAQIAQDCSQIAVAEALVEPWEENTRTFSNGRTRVALLDTVEPAAAAFHLLVLSPPHDELGARQCRVISAAPGFQGFGGIDLAGMAADYDPAVGLIFTLPVTRFDPETGGYPNLSLVFTLNQATGAIGFR